MALHEILAFEATSLVEIAQKSARAASTFRSGRTKDLVWRKVQLRKLYWAIEDYAPLIKEALLQDLHKSAQETHISEISTVQSDCLYLLSQLDKLAADEKLGVPDVPFTFALAGFRTRKEPLGAVLIIGAYNFPVQLLLGPLLGALAAGCTVVVKPSELAPATAMVLRKMLEDRLDNDAVQVVNGAIPETTALLDFRDTESCGLAQGSAEIPHGWAKIVYTGSRPVARIVASKAAQTLTPVVLELGGLNPAIVTAQAPDVALAARRLLWGKTLAAGQVCLSHNYVLVQRSVLDTFLRGLEAAFVATFPDANSHDSELAHVANSRHFSRLQGLLKQSSGRVVIGGKCDEKTLFMEPTAVLIDSVDDPLLHQETFGPLFSILAFDTLDEAIQIANGVDSTPLALYAFGSKVETDRILWEVNSGGATVNDSFLHASISTVAFGGVGHSGMGAYHGRASFDTFTHLRTVATTPGWMEKFLRVRYMPYDKKELKLYNMTAPSANFDRSGKIVRGLGYWLRMALGLGSPSSQGALMRWLGCLAVILAALYGVDRHLPQRLLLLVSKARK